MKPAHGEPVISRWPVTSCQNMTLTRPVVAATHSPASPGSRHNPLHLLEEGYKAEAPAASRHLMEAGLGPGVRSGDAASGSAVEARLEPGARV